jgi:hypothetical protein
MAAGSRPIAAPPHAAAPRAGASGSAQISVVHGVTAAFSAVQVC